MAERLHGCFAMKPTASLFAIAAALAACAGADNGDDGVTATELLDRIGTVECDQAFACKATFPTDQGATFEEAFGATAQACYADAAQFYDAAGVEASIAAGKIKFDTSAANACLAGLQGIATPACATFWADGVAFPNACDNVFAGTVAQGGACANDLECAGDSICGDTNKCEVAQ